MYLQEPQPLQQIPTVEDIPGAAEDIRGNAAAEDNGVVAVEDTIVVRDVLNVVDTVAVVLPDVAAAAVVAVKGSGHQTSP